MNESHPLEDIYRLTPLQEGILFHSIAAATPGLYIVQSCWTLRGPLDPDRLSIAWGRATGRHQALRTAFEWHDLEKPVQLVYSRVGSSIEHLDWSRRAGPDQNVFLDRFLEQDRRRGFDLSTPPLHRLTIARHRDDHWYVVWSFHQAILDGWSAGLVRSDVARICDDAGVGPTNSPHLPAPFRIYMDWLHRQRPENAEAFWRNRLAGFTAPTRLLPGRDLSPTSILATGRSEAVLDFDESFTQGLVGSLRRSRLTLNTLVQAAWAIVLSRRSGSRDVLFGAVVSGRPPWIDGIESMVGCFINTIPMRIRVPSTSCLDTWMKDIQAEFLEAREFEHCALVDIQGWSEVRRGRALFDTILAFENYPVGDPNDGWGGDTEVIDFQARENLNYPMTLYAGVIAGRLTVSALFDRQQFNSSTVGLILDEVRSVVEVAAEDLGCDITAAVALPSTEKRLLISDWNQTRVDDPSGSTFRDLFERRVSRDPGRRAVVCADSELSYGELDARANGAAHAFANAGIGPEKIVGILADRDIDFLIAMLGAFKIGAAYLPLDPRTPANRLAQTLQQAEIALVLRSDRYAALCDAAAKAASGPAPPFDSLKAFTGAPAAAERPQVDVSFRHLAYIIFTSGSTGVPKGAMVEQRGMVNHLLAKIRDLGLVQDDRIAQNASQCFDISVWQFLAALLVGGETHIIPDDIALDPKTLAEYVSTRGVTILETVPSLLRFLVDGENRPGPLRHAPLRWLVPTGEALPPDLAATWHALYPQVPILNAYGPTECSDDVTHHRVDVELGGTGGRVPIGRPIANTEIYIVDERMDLVPIGVPGELFVGGIGVGRGYANDPIKTAECFVPDPFGTRPGGRLYRTGDLARHLPDGTIDYQGRMDHQVKIRGIRIELGDIESALAEMKGLTQSVVVAWQDPRGEDRLVAYLTAQDEIPSIGALREHLARYLPDSMIPQIFVPLDKMPLTPNGKLDRVALPEPEDVQSSAPDGILPPGTRTEKFVASVWRIVLETDNVGRSCNFFELGGHSLMMLRVLERIRGRYPQLVLVDLFQHPTVEALARFLDSGGQPPEIRSDSRTRDTRFDSLRRLRTRRIKARSATGGHR